MLTSKLIIVLAGLVLIGTLAIVAPDTLKSVLDYLGMHQQSEAPPPVDNATSYNDMTAPQSLSTIINVYATIPVAIRGLPLSPTIYINVLSRPVGYDINRSISMPIRASPV